MDVTRGSSPSTRLLLRIRLPGHTEPYIPVPREQTWSTSSKRLRWAFFIAANTPPRRPKRRPIALLSGPAVSTPNDTLRGSDAYGQAPAVTREWG